MVHAILYATKDVLTPARHDGGYYVVVVNVCDESCSQKGIQQITQLAAQYLGTDTSPLYVLHVFPKDNRLDVSFAAEDDEQFETDAANSDPTYHCPLHHLIEREGIAPLLRAAAASFQARTSSDVLTCNCANLAFESQPALEDGIHEVALGNAVHVDFTLPVHAPLKAFLTMCQSQA